MQLQAVLHLVSDFFILWHKANPEPAQLCYKDIQKKDTDEFIG